jgi:hypothetical protein
MLAPKIGNAHTMVHRSSQPNKHLESAQVKRTKKRAGIFMHLSVATIPQEEHPLTHPKQFHRSYSQPLSLHPHHSVTIKHHKKCQIIRQNKINQLVLLE